MGKGKWGESFLKSGLPLEHLAMATFSEKGWFCEPSAEYQRENREGKTEWFELDFMAESPSDSAVAVDLQFIVECKYHDPSRFWIMLPHTPDRWHFDDRLLNFVPFEMLQAPRDNNLLPLAHASTRGVVVSEDGLRQDDALYTAIQQLTNGFVPLLLERGFSNNLDVQPGHPPIVTAFTPMIVTNASLFRLRPSVTDLAAIRAAKSPIDVADEVPWTWCYFDPSRAQFEQQLAQVDHHREYESSLFKNNPGAEERMRSLPGRPNWIAVVGIQHLHKAIDQIYLKFKQLPMLSLDKFVRSRPQRKRVSKAAAKTG